jgi:hypothetical protein
MAAKMNEFRAITHDMVDSLPLLYAIYFGRLKFVKYMYSILHSEHGFDFKTWRCGSGNIINNDDGNCIRDIVTRMASEDDYFAINFAARFAMRCGKVNILRWLYKLGITCSKLPISYLIEKKHYEMIKFLILHEMPDRDHEWQLIAHDLAGLLEMFVNHHHIQISQYHLDDMATCDSLKCIRWLMASHKSLIGSKQVATNIDLTAAAQIAFNSGRFIARRLILEYSDASTKVSA